MMSNESSPGDTMMVIVTSLVYDNVTTSDNTSLSEADMHVSEAVLFVLLTAVCIGMTIIGNLLVVLSVFTYRPLKVVQNFYIVSLAVADMLVASLVMPFNVANYVIGRWVFGEIFCNVWLTADILMCTASILNLCAIAIDRYYAIHDPISYALKRTFWRVLAGIGIAWILSAIISVPPLMGWNNADGRSLYDPQSQTCQLTSEKGFVIYSACGSFYIPLVIMTFVYIKVFAAARKRLKARTNAAAVVKVALYNNSPSSVKNGASTNGNGIRPDSPTIQPTTPMRSGPDVPAVAEMSSAGSPGSPEDTQHMPTPDMCPPNDGSQLHVTFSAYTMQTADSNYTVCSALTAFSSSNDALLKPSSSPISAVSTRVDASSSISPHRRERRASSRADQLMVGGALGTGSTGSESGTVVSNRSSARKRSGTMASFIEKRQKISLSKERRAARTMAIIMGAFVACWLPFFLMYVIFPFCEYCEQNTSPRAINFIVWLGYVNSALNPVIYTVFNVDFRRSFKNLLGGKCL